MTKHEFVLKCFRITKNCSFSCCTVVEHIIITIKSSRIQSCKVKSFSFGEWRDDPHFREIFNVEAPLVKGQYKLRDGVEEWSKPLEQQANEAAERARETVDIQRQEDVMAEEPGAFGEGGGGGVSGVKSRGAGVVDVQADDDAPC